MAYGAAGGMVAVREFVLSSGDWKPSMDHFGGGDACGGGKSKESATMGFPVDVVDGRI